MTEPSPIANFDEALALRTVGDGRLTADIQEGWDIRGVPHGGYLLAMVAAAARTVTVQQDPLSVSATYLAPPEFGPAPPRIHCTSLVAWSIRNTASRWRADAM